MSPRGDSGESYCGQGSVEWEIKLAILIRLWYQDHPLDPIKTWQEKRIIFYFNPKYITDRFFLIEKTLICSWGHKGQGREARPASWGCRWGCGPATWCELNKHFMNVLCALHKVLLRTLDVFASVLKGHCILTSQKVHVLISLTLFCTDLFPMISNSILGYLWI